MRIEKIRSSGATRDGPIPPNQEHPSTATMTAIQRLSGFGLNEASAMAAIMTTTVATYRTVVARTREADTHERIQSSAAVSSRPVMEWKTRAGRANVSCPRSGFIRRQITKEAEPAFEERCEW